MRKNSIILGSYGSLSVSQTHPIAYLFTYFFASNLDLFSHLFPRYERKTEDRHLPLWRTKGDEICLKTLPTETQ